MALTPEDIAGIQTMIDTGLMPQVEKLVEEKVSSGLSGLTSVVQGLLNSSSETPEGAPSANNPQIAGVLGILASLGPVLLQVLPMLKGHQQTDPMAQFNQMASMMQTASNVMLAPVMDIWRQGMSFGVNAVSVAQRVTGQVDGAAFDQLIQTHPMAAKVNPSNGQVDSGAFDYDAFTRSTSTLGDKGYQ